MEDPAYTSLTPRSFVMTSMACFYCGALDSSQLEIEHLFGLKHCALHKKAALRDCKAYLHTEKRVRACDAFAHPVIGKFLNIVKELEFPVLRSSGEYQPGWHMNINPYTFSTSLACNRPSGEWMLPVIYDSEGVSPILKYVSIETFKSPEFLAAVAVPADFIELLNAAVYCLIDGLYTREYDDVQSLDGPKEIPEIPGIETIEFEGGTARIFVRPPPDPVEETGNPS